MENQLKELSLPMHPLLAELILRCAVESAQKNIAGLSQEFVEVCSSVFFGLLYSIRRHGSYQLVYRNGY